MQECVCVYVCVCLSISHLELVQQLTYDLLCCHSAVDLYISGSPIGWSEYGGLGREGWKDGGTGRWVERWRGIEIVSVTR